VTEDATGLVQADFVAKMTQRTLDLRAEGYSFRQIGKELGVSGQSAHRWYTRARAVQLQELRGLRETAFYRDLAAIQDKLDQCEAVWDVTAADSMPRLAGLIKLYETKAKFLRYADLEFAEESAEPPTREQLAERLARVRRIVGDRIEE
tara:strand:- start:13558 stop:14004 length:447 start_codon:yes stop_codon:yes gene_type:complete